jgi:hypothetical protein
MYKKFLLVLSTLLFTCSVILGQSRTVMVDTTGTLKYPSATTFAEKNNLATQNNLSLLIDGSYNITAGGVPTSELVSDFEIKVLNDKNELLYHFSTIYAHTLIHPSDKEDTNATLCVSYSGYGEENGVLGYTRTSMCARNKVILYPATHLQTLWNSYGSLRAYMATYSGRFQSSTSLITGIQFYPSSKFLSVFLDPKNTILVLRWGLTNSDKDSNNNKAWKQVPMLYIPKPTN